MENNFEKNQQHHGHDHGYDEHHDHTLIGELVCHLPYAVFSVAIGLAVLSFLTYFTIVRSIDDASVRNGAGVLFHSFHFMHILFASTGTLITYFRFSKNMLQGLLVGIISSTVFCTLSDAVIPYLAGEVLGVNMSFHWCFLTEMHNILPFLFIGLLNGVVMSRHHPSKQGMLSVLSHFFHILISSFASIFYLVWGGFTCWYASIGMVFLFLIIAVVIPCTLSDVVIPMLFARTGTNHEKH
ncbi:MAG TPA: hypothetical protein VGT41_02225 [Candidatus Babeliales bacterium]|nr:hypothetical protein [Candidatus Babeliales bacterium]